MVVFQTLSPWFFWWQTIMNHLLPAEFFPRLLGFDALPGPSASSRAWRQSSHVDAQSWPCFAADGCHGSTKGHFERLRGSKILEGLPWLMISIIMDSISMPGLDLGIPWACLLGFLSLRAYLGFHWQFQAGLSGVLCWPGQGEPFGGLGWIQG